jgi:uncharacterized membrane protein
MNDGFAKSLRIAHLHFRLLVSIAIGAVAFLLVPGSERLTTRVLIGWDVTVTVYLVLAFFMISRFDLERVKQRCAVQDEGGVLVLVLTVFAAVASLAAIIAELGSIRGTSAADAKFYIACALLTIALSWTFIHMIFTLHYAHEYYGEGRDGTFGGLEFPKDDQPDYWDFLYFAFVVGMTFQVSDVQVTSKFIRRLVVAHGAVSFVFNVAILSVMVNISSEFIK